MHIGIDFGTTHTTAVCADGDQLHFMPLDPFNRDPHLLRSMLYINRAQESILGLQAVETFLKDNTGRLAKLEQKKVGTIENTVSRVTRMPLEPDGPITIIYDVIIEEDVGAPGRLLQSIKTGLRDPEYLGTSIFDQFYTIEQLIAILLTHTAQVIEKETGQSATAVTLGRPVQFSEAAKTDALAEARLRRAAELAGFQTIRFLPEPVAAALFYTRRITHKQNVLVFDFGGGTLDLTVLHADPKAAVPTAILGTQGVLLGGDDFDTAIMQNKVVNYFGVNSKIDPQGHPFPAHLASKLHRWQTIPELSKIDAIPTIRRAKINGNDPKGFAALESLVMKNYGFALFEKIEQTKCALSEQEVATLSMHMDSIQLDMPLTRREFQTFILDELARTQQGIDAVLRKAAVSHAQIDVVVTTGGSSLIPVFRTVLKRKFPHADLVHSDTFGSVAAGLAIHAAAQAS